MNLNLQIKNSDRVIAGIVTTLVALLLLLFLLMSKLMLPDRDKVWPPVPEAEIIAEMPDEETYVEILSAAGQDVTDRMDIDDFGASAQLSDDDTQASDEIANTGADEGTQTNLVTSTAPSAMQQHNVDRPGNTAPRPDPEAELRAQQQQRSNQINSQMGGAFSGAGNGQGRVTQSDGTSHDGGTGNRPGNGSMLTMSRDIKIESSESGQVVIVCRVLPGGKVDPQSVRFEPQGSSSFAAVRRDIQDACIAAARECQFRRDANDRTTVPGKIIYHIR